MSDNKPALCPLCRGDGGVSLDVIEAFKLGKAYATLVGPDFEKWAEHLSRIIGDQVADILSDYHVALVRTENR